MPLLHKYRLSRNDNPGKTVNFIMKKIRLMSTVEIRTEIDLFLDQVDESFLKVVHSMLKAYLEEQKEPPLAPHLIAQFVTTYRRTRPKVQGFCPTKQSPSTPLSKRPSQIHQKPPLKTNNLQTSIALSKTSTFMIHHSPVHSIQLNFASPFTASPLPSPLPAPALPPPFPGGCGSGGGYCRRGS